jgi:osmotically-inducible protein OsmY
LVVSLVWALPAVLVGCNRKSSAPAPVQVTNASVAPHASSAKPLADTDIAHAIERHLEDEGLLHAAHVQVAVVQGIASISGQVGSLLAKERAVAVTESIRGVRSVVDRVTVAPAARSDQQIQRELEAKLQHDPVTRSYAIGVAVKDGVVTLSGATDSWQEQRLFDEVAKGVRGVKEIDDQIAVHYTVERPEAEILAEVKHRLANDLWLDGATLNASVTNRTVHLSGTVGSVAEKTRARNDGWALGVDTVDDAAVVVDASAHDDQRRMIDPPLRSDAEIAAAVHDAFVLDPRLKKLMPEASASGGVVTLTGNVDSPEARRAAERDARDTLGVWRVEDEVAVQPDARPKDADLERSVKRALSEDLLLPDAKSIEVSSAKGKVVLKGTVASDFERFDAVEDAVSVPGVAAVDMGLVVKHTPEQIQARATDRIFWDPRVERDRVTVTVAPDGVATLKGTLDSWSEIKAAGDDALRAGAVRVINLLTWKKHPEVRAP